MSKGYVYVLSNPAMPGLVKIGRSIHGGRHRADIFYKGATGMPKPFVVEFEMMTDDAAHLESLVHKYLSIFRVDRRREYFEVAAADAEMVVLECAVKMKGIGNLLGKDIVDMSLHWESSHEAINAELVSQGRDEVQQDMLSYYVDSYLNNTSNVVDLVCRESDEFDRLINEFYAKRAREAH